MPEFGYSIEAVCAESVTSFRLPMFRFPMNAKTISAGGNEEAVSAVSRLFGGTAELSLIESISQSIPGPLRYVRGADLADAKWTPPLEVIGVTCGLGSQSLCAIIFENESELRSFLQQNPALQRTLVTCWPPCFVVWLHPTDCAPKNLQVGAVSWISSGKVPVGSVGLPTSHFVSRDHPVASVPFMKLEWPSEMRDALRILFLEETFGPRYRRLGSRKSVLNLTFWAHLLAAKMQLVYNVEQETFFRPEQGGKTLERVTLDELMKLISFGLQQARNLDSRHFPVSEIRWSNIKELVEEMKVAAAIHTAAEREGLAQALRKELEPRKGADATIAEIRQRYLVYCQRERVPIYPESVFQRVLPIVVKETFGGMVKSHDLKRPGVDGIMRCRRGFHGLGFKSESKADSADASDGPDALTSNQDSIPNAPT
jgi:hypothetical protein